METEAATARRRISFIAAHFTPNQDIISATPLLPMNCSGSLNSVIRRFDNRLYFARQNSVSQACFMRQISSEQGTAGVPLNSSGSTGCYPSATKAPSFSRPAKRQLNFSRTAAPRQDCKLSNSDCPLFSRPNISKGKPLYSLSRLYSAKSNGTAWSPRMDIAESGHNYVMTVEVPGVRSSDIRVEVDDQNLTVTGQRSTQCWNIAGHSNDSITAYHRKEISQGAYRVSWPLPTNANRETVSAELMDGFLQIIIPKL
ncbi:hypothetical protein SLEP1_g15100 [Rubroshorea leprosula]|uniref:SHSP domain-containing protein n=2 Tax=Rubroshorea leprosula TaxID=152421 RepID=A0AAV5ILB4_9ROSI|nr:hypothetical protein SLEP1_g15100 [Rubroshorea leprosula]